MCSAHLYIVILKTCSTAMFSLIQIIETPVGVNIILSKTGCFFSHGARGVVPLSQSSKGLPQ
jgi:hypothetical protein